MSSAYKLKPRTARGTTPPAEPLFRYRVQIFAEVLRCPNMSPPCDKNKNVTRGRRIRVKPFGRSERSVTCRLLALLGPSGVSALAPLMEKADIERAVISNGLSCEYIVLAQSGKPPTAR